MEKSKTVDLKGQFLFLQDCRNDSIVIRERTHHLTRPSHLARLCLQPSTKLQPQEMSRLEHSQLSSALVRCEEGTEHPSVGWGLHSTARHCFTKASEEARRQLWKGGSTQTNLSHRTLSSRTDSGLRDPIAHK